METGAILYVVAVREDASGWRDGGDARPEHARTMATADAGRGGAAGRCGGRRGAVADKPRVTTAGRDAVRLSTRLGFAATSRSRSGVGARWQDKKTGETPVGKRRCRRRRCMGTVGVFAATEAVVFNAVAGRAGGAAFRAPVTRPGGCLRAVGARPRECAQAGAHPAAARRCNLGRAAAPAGRRRHPRPGACRGGLFRPFAG